MNHAAVAAVRRRSRPRSFPDPRRRAADDAFGQYAGRFRRSIRSRTYCPLGTSRSTAANSSRVGKEVGVFGARREIRPARQNAPIKRDSSVHGEPFFFCPPVRPFAERILIAASARLRRPDRVRRRRSRRLRSFPGRPASAAVRVFPSARSGRDRGTLPALHDLREAERPIRAAAVLRSHQLNGAARSAFVSGPPAESSSGFITKRKSASGSFRASRPEEVDAERFQERAMKVDDVIGNERVRHLLRIKVRITRTTRSARRRARWKTDARSCRAARRRRGPGR
jgi:hypothetical protein